MVNFKNNKKNYFDIAVIGNGIAAKCFLWELFKQCGDNFSGPPLSILKIWDDQEFKPCSQNSTGIVSLFGAKSNLGELGEILKNGLDSFLKFQLLTRPKGIIPVNHYFLADETGPNKIVNKFGNAKLDQYIPEVSCLFKNPVFYSSDNSWLINPKEFLSNFDHLIDQLVENNKKNIKLSKKVDKVIDIYFKSGLVVLVTEKGEEISCSTLVLCTGAYSKTFENQFSQFPPLINSKVVEGRFAEFKDIEWGAKSFILSIGGQNLIYRSEDHRLIIGGGRGQECELAQVRELKEIAHLFQNILSKKFPLFQTAEFKSGLRHKGPKRVPFWGELGGYNRGLQIPKGKVFGLFNLYKNGFSYPFYGAGQLVSELRKKEIGPFNKKDGGARWIRTTDLEDMNLSL